MEGSERNERSESSERTGAKRSSENFLRVRFPYTSTRDKLLQSLKLKWSKIAVKMVKQNIGQEDFLDNQICEKRI